MYLHNAQRKMCKLGKFYINLLFFPQHTALHTVCNKWPRVIQFFKKWPFITHEILLKFGKFWCKICFLNENNFSMEFHMNIIGESVSRLKIRYIFWCENSACCCEKRSSFFLFLFLFFWYFYLPVLGSGGGGGDKTYKIEPPDPITLKIIGITKNT